MTAVLGGLAGAMGFAINKHGAHSTNAFSAVVVKYHGINTLTNQLLVEHINHFQERHVIADLIHLVGFHAAFVLRAVLAPNVERKFHL